MKKIYTIYLAMSVVTGSWAQSMNENFDSYVVGSYMGVNSGAWTTWSGAVGGTEDTQVSTAQSVSGANSVYFVSSSSGGGPQDVVVPFGGEYSTGQFDFEMNVFVVSNKGAYFNFQGNTTLGQVWSLNCQMVQTGDLILDDGSGNFIQTTYPTGQWFTLALDINLNLNEWELLIDGVSQGVMQNSYNQLASIDIYPVNSSYGGNNQCGFYIDDFYYLHTPYVLPVLNGAVTSLGNVNCVTGLSLYPSITMRNLGTTTITSFDLTIDYNGTQVVQNVTGVNIPSLATYDVDYTAPVLIVAGAMPFTATISNVNGSGADMDPIDDSKSVTINPPTPAAGKVVVAEEGTGTWCQWCPRGAVYMDFMTEKYGSAFAGIAVHNSDPMTNDLYDAAIGPLLSGYPSALVDRLPSINPSAIEADFLDEIAIAPKAFMTAVADYNATSGVIEITVSADFQSAVSGDYRLACVITEDSVTGTTSDWAQSNAYSGGANGEMGGFELLPNPVPAALMNYNHVGREILPAFDGQAGSIPASVAAGEVHSYTFSATLPATYDLSQIHIIPLLIAPSGKIDNAGSFEFSELVGIDELVPATSFVIYPNPATDFAQIKLNAIQNETVIVRIYDLNGKMVAEKNYGTLNGDMILPVAAHGMNTGVYMVQLTVGDVLQTARLVVE